MPISVLTKTDFDPRDFLEAEDHFARKAALTSDQFAKLSREAKQRAFRIAGVHDARLIQDVRDKIASAIKKGTAWSEVQRNILAAFDAKQIPRPALYRLKQVFVTNTQQAYSDARWDAQMEVDDLLPYRQYMTLNDARVRDTHRALHGLIFRSDDPFWLAHKPPWEFGCRCFFNALSEGDVRRSGQSVRTLGFVRRKLGIKENPAFARGIFNLAAIAEELRTALKEMIE